MSIVIEPDLREEGDQKFALDVVVGHRVERAGLLQQVQVVQDHIVLLLDDVRGGREPLCQGVPLHLELAQPVAHLVGGEGTVGDEIEQSFFLDIEGGQLLLHARMGFMFGLEPLVKTRHHLLAHGGKFVR